MRLNHDHPLIQQIEADETVLRRFRPKHTDDPDEVGDFVIDEGRGGQRVLSGQALRFDEDGCSVYRSSVLAEAQIDESEILHPNYQYIARAMKSDIDAFTFTFADGRIEQPFHVHASPYAPGTSEEDYEAAHASITMQTDASNSRRRQLVKQVARKTFACDPVELAALEADKQLD